MCENKLIVMVGSGKKYYICIKIILDWFIY